MESKTSRTVTPDKRLVDSKDRPSIQRKSYFVPGLIIPVSVIGYPVGYRRIIIDPSVYEDARFAGFGRNLSESHIIGVEDTAPDRHIIETYVAFRVVPAGEDSNL